MSTVVTGTLVDSKGRVWANAPVQLTFSPAFGAPGPFEWSGGIFNKMPPTIHTDSLGRFSITVPSNNEIIPANTSWFITIGPNATLPAIVLNVSLITGSLDISALFTVRATPGLAQSFPIPRAYNDSDVIVPPNSGQLYYNVTSKTLKYYEDGAWQPVSGGGGGSMVYPPVGVAVSGGSFWQDSIPQDNIPLLDALNIFTQPIFTPAVISQGDLVLEGAGYTKLNWDAGLGLKFGNGAGVEIANMNPDGTLYVRSLWAYNTGAAVPSSVLLDYLPGSANGVARLLSSSTDNNPGSISIAGVNNAGGNYCEYIRIHGETPAALVQVMADLQVDSFGAATGKVTVAGVIKTLTSFNVDSNNSIVNIDIPGAGNHTARLYSLYKGGNAKGGFQFDGYNTDLSRTITWFAAYEDGTGDHFDVHTPMTVAGPIYSTSLLFGGVVSTTRQGTLDAINPSTVRMVSVNSDPTRLGGYQFLGYSSDFALACIYMECYPDNGTPTVNIGATLSTGNGLAVVGAGTGVPFRPGQTRIVNDGSTGYVDATGPNPSTRGNLVVRVMGSDSSGIMSILNVDANGIYVAGSIGASGAKTFVIDHPFDNTKQLVHSCLEGPENALFYRGEVVTQGGVAEVTLPHYFEALTFTEDRSVQLTVVVDESNPIFGGQVAAGRIKNGKFKVFSTDATATIAWEVKAVRKLGVDRLKVERLKTESL